MVENPLVLRWYRKLESLLQQCILISVQSNTNQIYKSRIKTMRLVKITFHWLIHHFKENIQLLPLTLPQFQPIFSTRFLYELKEYLTIPFTHAYHNLIHRLINIPLSKDNFNREVSNIKHIANLNNIRINIDKIISKKLKTNALI